MIKIARLLNARPRLLGPEFFGPGLFGPGSFGATSVATARFPVSFVLMATSLFPVPDLEHSRIAPMHHSDLRP
jgi:hypothetical protein